MQINTVINDKGDVATDSTEIQQNPHRLLQALLCTQAKNLEKTDKFQDTYNF